MQGVSNKVCTDEMALPVQRSMNHTIISILILISESLVTSQLKNVVSQALFSM